jgi:hypothetical protein
VQEAWHVCQSAAFVARGLPPARKVDAAKPACASVVAERTLLRTLHVRSSEKASWPNFLELRVCELRRIPIPRTPVNRAAIADGTTAFHHYWSQEALSIRR